LKGGEKQLKKEKKVDGKKKSRQHNHPAKKRKIVVEDRKGPFSAEKRKLRSEEKRIKRKKVGLRLRIAKSDLIASGRAKEKLQTLGEKLQTKHVPTAKEIASLNNKLKKLHKKQKDFNMKKAHLRNAMKKTSVHIKNMRLKIRDLKKGIQQVQ